MHPDTVRCHLCGTDLPRDVAFRCYRDRRGQVRLGPADAGPWDGAYFCPRCAALIGRGGREPAAAEDAAAPVAGMPLEALVAVPWLLKGLRALQHHSRTEMGHDELRRACRGAIMATRAHGWDVGEWQARRPVDELASTLAAYTIYRYVVRAHPCRVSRDNGEHLYTVAGLIRTLEALAG